MDIAFHGINHAGINASDFDRSLAWYQEVLGMVPDGRQPWTGTTETRVAFLHPVGNPTFRIELISRPDFPTNQQRDVWRHGAVHICLETSDIHAAYRALQEEGVEIISAPMQLPDGSNKRSWLMNIADPDGVRIEIAQWASQGGSPPDR